jgi:hypothetical protein
MVKIFSSMMAAIGRQLKQSVKVFHSLMLYLRLPVDSEQRMVSHLLVERVVDPLDELRALHLCPLISPHVKTTFPAARPTSAPQLERRARRTFIVEAVNPVDGGALVITTEDEEVLGVLDLVGEEEADGLERLLAPIDVIAEEEVVGFGGESSVLKQAEQVVILSVNVTCGRRVEFSRDCEREGR